MALLRLCFGYQFMLQKQHSNRLSADKHAVLSVNKLIDPFCYERRTLRNARNYIEISPFQKFLQQKIR